MGNLPQFLLALVALAFTDADVGPLRVSLVGCCALALVPFGLAALAAQLGQRGKFRSAQLAATLLALAAPVLHTAAVLGFGWVELVEAWSGKRPTLNGWVGPMLLAGLLPYFVYEVLAIEARVRFLGAAATRSISRNFALRVLVASALPLVALALLSGAVSLSYPARVWIEEVSVAAIGATVCVAVLFAGGLPFLLVTVWGCRSLERHGWQYPLVSGLAREAGVRIRDIVLWPTGGRIANAAVVGFAPWNRYLLFTDAMLARLGPRELAGVIGHELGHVRRSHVPAFAAWTGALFLTVDLVQVHWGEASIAAGLGVLGAAVVAWYLGFGMLSRRFELEADLEGMELTGDPEALVTALEGLRVRRNPQRRSWRHFGTARRVEFLRTMQADPDAGRAFHRVLRRWRWAGVCALVVALTAQGLAWAERLPLERLWVDLRMGDYTQAVARAESLPELDDFERALIARGAAAPVVSSPEAWGLYWEAQARDELFHRKLQQAGESLTLAVLAGREDLDEARRALGAAGEGVAPGPELAEPWLGLLTLALSPDP